jgi:hypothetical protein
MKKAELKEAIRQAMLKEVGTLSKVTGKSGTTIAQVVAQTDVAALTAAGAKVTPMEGTVTENKSDALMQLQNILEELQMLADQARDIIAENFPSHLTKGEAYGAFDLGSSSNRYDTTLASIVADIEEYGDEGEELDEGRGNKEFKIPTSSDPNQIYVLSGAIGYFKVKNGEWDRIGLTVPDRYSREDVITIKPRSEGEDEEGEEELNEAPYTMMSKVLPQDYDKITGKINSGLVEMGHWLEQNYDGNALPELQSIQDAYTEFDNKITHGADEEYEGGDLGTPGDNALGLEEVVKKADAIIAGYRK